MSKNIIEIALNAGFLNTSNGLESPFIEGEDLTDNLKLFASLLLAQPEQEPVAWKVIDETNGEYMFSRVKPMERAYKYDVVIPLYLAPPKPLTPRQGLEEYKRGYDKGWKACKYCYTNEELREGVVGYLYKQMDCHGEWATIFKVDKPYITWHDIKDIVPVYTTQPKREPLSIQEIYDLDKYSHQPFAIYNVRECISWIRKVEKAHGITGGGE